MEQLLIHLFSDYWLQNDWMATNKKKKWLPAIVHGIVYTLPFLLLTRSFLALLIIGVTHIIIDHTDIVAVLNRIKNWDFKPKELGYFRQLGCGLLSRSHMGINDGFAVDRPLFIRVWLLIIQDNILHLIINYLALKYC